jgi:hypothetical protein
MSFVGALYFGGDKAGLMSFKNRESILLSQFKGVTIEGVSSGE